MYQPLNFLLCTALLLLHQVSAAPTGKKSLVPRSFKVRAHARARHVHDPHRAMRKAYGKWDIPLPEALIVNVSAAAPVVHSKAADPSGQSGQVPTSASQYDLFFVSPVQIGGQTIMMDFDTGSADLWVFSTNMPPEQTVGHTPFDPAKSSTFQPLTGSTFKISFGDSSHATGKVGIDTVNIGGATVSNQAVELAVDVSASFVKDVQSNGLVGLGFSNVNTVKPKKQLTFFDNIRDSLAQPVFTANLKHAATGFYEFGKIDSAQFKGDLTFTSIDPSKGFWQFPSTTFSVGNGPVQQNAESNPAIADTGTSLLLVDDSIVNGYYSQVNGAAYDPSQGGVTFPCDTTLPDLHLALGPSYTATIPGALMNFAPVSAVGGGQSAGCFGAMQSSKGSGVQILGDVLFKAQFVVFNNGDMTIGFADHA